MSNLGVEGFGVRDPANGNDKIYSSWNWGLQDGSPSIPVTTIGSDDGNWDTETDGSSLRVDLIGVPGSWSSSLTFRVPFSKGSSKMTTVHLFFFSKRL